MSTLLISIGQRDRIVGQENDYAEVNGEPVKASQVPLYLALLERIKGNHIEINSMVSRVSVEETDYYVAQLDTRYFLVTDDVIGKAPESEPNPEPETPEDEDFIVISL
jgi:hypothetical protein